jgi:hypothetical protein
MFILGHAGAICTAPITTSNYPPARWGTATFLSTMLGITWTERWLGDGSAEVASQVTRFNPTGFLLVELCENHCLLG